MKKAKLFESKTKTKKSLGIVSTLAGSGTAGYLDGPASFSQFSSPSDVCDDGFGNIYVADQYNYRIRLINSIANQGLSLFLSLSWISLSKSLQNTVSTYAGTGSQGLVDGPVLNAKYLGPYAIFCQSSTSLFVLDNYQYLRKIQNGLSIILTEIIRIIFNITFSLGSVTTLGNFTSVTLYSLLSMDQKKEQLYFGNRGYIYNYSSTGLEIPPSLIILHPKFSYSNQNSK